MSTTRQSQRLNDIISNLQREYTDEVRRLNNIITDIQSNYTGEIERLNQIVLELPRRRYNGGDAATR